MRIFHLFSRKSYSGEQDVKGETLLLARWVAIAGQSAAVLISHYLLGIALPILACMGCIALSALLNRLFVLQKRPRKMTPQGATASLSFDILQLTALLSLTGGMGNPFHILLLAPVLVGATLLPRVQVCFLAVLSLVAMAFLAHVFLPLAWPVPAENEINLAGLGHVLALGVTFLFTALYALRLAEENRALQKASYAARTTLLRQQQLQALGAQAAAAAHELGSPLGTIAIIAKELQHALGPAHPQAPDIALLLDQIQRCRHILKGFGDSLQQDPTYMADPLPLDALLSSVAEKFLKERKDVKLEILVSDPALGARKIPCVPQSPELLHGLGVYVQNAIQFAKERVSIRFAEKDPNLFYLTIHDDGPGFAPQVLSRLGEPYVSTRGGKGNNMGLGIFIAQTLLEETGAKISYSNRESGGALVTIEWNRRGSNLLFTSKT